MLAQSEAAAGSLAPELGYSVFHCGNEVLEVYRAVVLEVGLADIEPQSTDIYWIKSRCAVSTRLGADPIRLLYNRNDISMWGDMIALEVEEDEVLLGVDGVDGADGIDKDGSDMEIDR
jgi:hypothetical protein